MKRYSFKDFGFNIAAPPVVPTHRVQGFANGNDVFQAKRNSPSVKPVVGADGKGSVAVTADRSGTLMFKLEQTSPSNKVFAAIMALIEGGPATFSPIFIQGLDLYRQDAFAGTFGVITKWPDFSRGEELAEQEWEIWVERLDLVLGDPIFAGLPAAGAEAAF
jgi:hypothetical protein